MVVNTEIRERWRRNSAAYRERHGLHQGRCPRLPVLTPDQEARVVALYLDGYSVRRVAELVGATYDQTHGALRRQGVRMRPSRGAKQVTISEGSAAS